MELPGSVVVIPEDPELTRELIPVFRALGCKVAFRTPLSGTVLLVVPWGDEHVYRALFRAWPGIRTACPDFASPSGLAGCGSTGGVMTEPAASPGPSSGNDADFGLQWYLENTGQTLEQRCGPDPPHQTMTGTPGIDINIRDAWGITQGCEDVVVAVFDTGTQYEHPSFDLSRFFFPDLPLTCCEPVYYNVYSCCTGEPGTPGYGGMDCNFGDYAIDCGNHGTQVAAVIGAQGNNTNAISGYPEMSGVDLNCKLLSVRTAVTNGFSSFEYPLHGAAVTLHGLEIILTQEPYEAVRVVNMSYQLPCHYFGDEAFWETIQDGFDAAKAAGIIVVTISTNFGDGEADLWCPQKWDNVITVSGIDSQGGRWSGCNFVSGSGDAVDVCAPARGIYTALCDDALDPLNSPSIPESPCYIGAVQFDGGTSGAAPQVAGIVSLLIARADELGIPIDFDLVYELLTETATPLGSTSPNAVFGHGLVNAYEALRRLELLYYRPFNRADLTDHNDSGEWRFGVADGVVDCDDLNYFLNHAYPNQILEKADFTTGSVPGQPGYGVPNGQVTVADCIYYTQILHPGGCGGASCN